MSISENLTGIERHLREGVQLVAVSKYHPISELKEAYDAGQRVFGESHVQELVAKEEALPKDIRWHFIGHLQTNKVKYIAPFISLIHAVDTPKLLREIDKQAQRAGRTIDCLLQVHIAREETKYGFSPDELKAFLESGEWAETPHARICGLMCMATNTDDESLIHEEFARLRSLFAEAKASHFADKDYFKELSMGMSHDYMIAMDEGSTMVRVGSKIFGERDYTADFNVDA